MSSVCVSRYATGSADQEKIANVDLTKAIDNHFHFVVAVGPAEDCNLAPEQAITPFDCWQMIAATARDFHTDLVSAAIAVSQAKNGFDFLVAARVTAAVGTIEESDRAGNHSVGHLAGSDQHGWCNFHLFHDGVFLNDRVRFFAFLFGGVHLSGSTGQEYCDA